MSDYAKVYGVFKTKNFLKHLRNFKKRYFVSNFFSLFIQFFLMRRQQDEVQYFQAQLVQTSVV